MYAVVRQPDWVTQQNAALREEAATAMNEPVSPAHSTEQQRRGLRDGLPDRRVQASEREALAGKQRPLTFNLLFVG